MTKTKQDYIVTSLPYVNDYFISDNKQYAGEIELFNKVNYFFWLFTKNKPRGKLLIWLNGGPGCTSADGPLLEKGIFDMEPSLKGENYKIKTRENGWHSFVDVLAIDQPLGTGYSNGLDQFYSKTIDEAAYYFETFLTKFLYLFPEYQNSEIYIGGESYAGVWIPAFSHRLLNREDNKLNIKGLMIGNGWMDSKNQYPGILDYVKKYNVLDERDMLKFEEISYTCFKHLKSLTMNPISIPVCDTMLNTVTELSDTAKMEGSKTCINLYDRRLIDNYPDCGMGWPPNVNAFHSYMSEKKVSKALNTHQPKGGWTECNNDVMKYLKTENINSTIDYLPSLLDKLEILLFVGDQDIMVNYIGVEYMINNLTNSNINQQDKKYIGNNNNIMDGELLQNESLYYVKLFNGSHMVSYDLPEQTSNLFNWFINRNENQQFLTEEKGGNNLLRSIKNFNSNNNNNNEDGSLSTMDISIISISSVTVLLLLLFLIFWKWNTNRKQSQDKELLLQREAESNLSEDPMEEDIELR